MEESGNAAATSLWKEERRAAKQGATQAGSRGSASAEEASVTAGWGDDDMVCA